jgi:hypothetical protein
MDVVVCGGGALGSAVADACTRRGLSVLVVQSEAEPPVATGVERLDGRVAGAAHGRDESTVIVADGRIVDAAVIVDAADPPVLVTRLDRRQRVVGIGPAAAQTDSEARRAAGRLATAIGQALDRRATPEAISRAAWDAVRLPSWRSRLLRR